MNRSNTDTHIIGRFAVVSTIAWLLIFGLTVSESLFYYKIHEQPAPYKRILFNDLFILFWIPVSPILFKSFQALYEKKNSWFKYGMQVLTMCGAAIVIILSAESLLHYFSDANNVEQQSFTKIFVQLVTLRFQTNILLGLGFVATCIAYLGYNESQNLARKQEELNQNLMAAQLGVLKAQMKPHFLFNSLHAISGLILKQDNEKAISVIAKLSDLLRESIDMDSKKWITVLEELNYTQRYLDIYQLRFGNQLACSFDIDDRANGLLFPPALLQPIVENSIVHGIVPNDNSGAITVKMSLSEDKLHVSIQDKGSKSDLVDKEIKEGLGLSNCRKRLNSLFGSNFELSFHPEESKTLIVIPIVSQDQ